MPAHFYIEGYGCPSNTYDLRIIQTRLKAKGFEKVDNEALADLVVVNTCAVKKPTEDRILHRLSFLDKLRKPLIVSGCLPCVNLDAIERAAPNYLAVIGPNSLERIDEAVENLPSVRGLNFIHAEPLVKVGMASSTEKRLVEIIPISEGCLGDCAFCCTRFARGGLFSYPMEAIVDAVRRSVEHGAREIWLAAQDTGVYGWGQGTDLSTLLEKICEVDGEFIVRVGMMNPESCIPILDGIVDIFHHPKIFKFIHLPLQSGNNSVLGAMNRRYTVDEFLEVTMEFRQKLGDVTVWTDIICGYPTEDEEAFLDSLKIIERVQPDVVNVSKFSPRPGTAASSLKTWPSQVVKDRSRRMAKLCRHISLERNRFWLDWVGGILVDERGSDGTWIGRNAAYKPIVVRDIRQIAGRWLRVKVTDVKSTHLLGELLDPSE